MQSVPLDKKRHGRNAFDCGVDALNNYLKLMANQHASRDNSRTYVLEAPENNNRIMGFYTLAMTTIDLSSLPDPLRKRHPDHYSAGLIARLAVDRRYTRKGFGAWLLVDALKKLLSASDVVAFPIVVVDAKEGASEFYKKFGFIPFEHQENKLFITIADIRASFGR
jgi:GNAT superfamily N-acetyltransferase